VGKRRTKSSKFFNYIWKWS